MGRLLKYPRLCRNVIKLRKSRKEHRRMVGRSEHTPDRINLKKGTTKRQTGDLAEKVLTQGKNYDNL